MNKCFICKQLKEPSEFHSNKGRSTGLSSRCADCDKDYQKTRDRKKYMREYSKKNKKKMRAKWKLQYAIRKGLIKRGDCEVCSKKNAEAHHKDYTKPLEVVWLCRTHHMEQHRK